MISGRYKKKVAQGKVHWLRRNSQTSRFVNILKKKFHHLSELKVLDAGCAQGRDSAEISRKGVIVFGLDSNKKFISEAKAAYPKIKFKLGKIEHLPYKNEEFDAVYCVNTLFYTQPEESLPELERVVKSGGVIFLTLDKSIFDLDKKEKIHSLNVEKALKIFKKSRVVQKKYLERIDKEPFKHKHLFYEIVLVKK